MMSIESLETQMAGPDDGKGEQPGERPGGGRHESPISGFGEQPAEGGKVHYGGQAVIEGVMMRGPDRVATAIRLPGGEIAVHADEFTSVSKKGTFFRLPVIRGGLTLIESLSLGIKALNYSANAAMEAAEEKSETVDGEEAGESESRASAAEASQGGGAPGEGHGLREGVTDEARAAKPIMKAPARKESDWKTKAALTATMAFALGLGVLFFFYIPLVLTDRILVNVFHTESGILFNLIDGAIRVAFFLAYIWGISRWKEMRRVFEYHGAEHKTIFMQEAGEELTPANAEKYTTRHPRCGTSFLLIVMVVSILVFMLTGKPETIVHRLLRLLLLPVIAGISYEVMKLAAKKSDQPWARFLSAPGIWLQSITTKEPSCDQLEVAIAALTAVKIDANAGPSAAGVNPNND
jgi:uncharacterized protein YqhQ